MIRAAVLFSAIALAGSAFAQAGAGEQRACGQARDASKTGDAVMQATYANCLVMGVVQERNALVHARELARKSMKQGSEIGAFALYAAYAKDPAYAFMKDGQPDMERYKALAARPVEARAEQVEAIDALAFAYSKSYPKAMQALSVYYYETVAPKNVARLRTLAAAMKKDGVNAPWLERFGKEAARVAAAGDTKASVHTFLDAEKPATLAATAMLSKDGARCGSVKLAHVESGELRDPVFLPLKAPAVRESYLVRGSWDEHWRFEGCGREATVPVHFAADGWGGATFRTPGVHVRS